MDRERALTLFLVAFTAGSTAFFVVLIVVGGVTEGADALRFGSAAAVGLLTAVATGGFLHRTARDEQLTGR